MHPHLLRSQQIDQRAADPRHQWIAAGQGDHGLTGEAVEQFHQSWAHRARPGQPLLARIGGRHQVEESGAAQQDLGLPDQDAQALGELLPPARGQPDDLDHVPDPSPAAHGERLGKLRHRLRCPKFPNPSQAPDQETNRQC